MPPRLRRPRPSVFTAKHRQISQKGEGRVLPGGFGSTDNKLYSAFLGLGTHASPACTDLALLARHDRVRGKWRDDGGQTRSGGAFLARPEQVL